MNGEYITKDTINRIIKDVKELIKHPLESHGIYYKHDSEDLLKGKALIIGQQDTPYENGYYLFEITLPINYPFSPPKFIFKTYDGVTRFNPNLYINGQVCLSILNTWDGEQWSSCQTISSILLVLSTILNNSPLLNEPDITKNHKDFNKYNEILKFKNIECAIIGMLKNEYINSHFLEFIPIMKTHFLTNYEKNINVIDKEIEQSNSSYNISIKIYLMDVNINYNKLKKDMKLLKCNLLQ